MADDKQTQLDALHVEHSKLSLSLMHLESQAQPLAKRQQEVVSEILKLGAEIDAEKAESGDSD